MQTWVKAKLLLNPTKEVLFAQDLVLSGNFGMLNAVELNPQHRAFNFVCKKMLNSLYHAKNVERAYFKKRKLIRVRAPLTTSFTKTNNYSKSFIIQGLYLRVFVRKNNNIVQTQFTLHNKISYSKTYVHTKNKGFLTSTGVNLFSTGVYRYYKSEWYKLLMTQPVFKLTRGYQNNLYVSFKYINTI